jgi:hypothetical protein
MTPLPPALRRSLPLVLLLAGLLVSGCSAGDTGRYSVTLVTQQQHTVAPGESLVGDTVVAGGTLVLDAGAEHRGSVSVLAGEVRVGGRIVGDLTILGGEVVLDDTAEVTGDVTTAGGLLTRDPAAVVAGDIAGPGPGSVLEPAAEPRTPAESVLWFGAAVILMAGLAWLAANLAPRPLRRIEAAVGGYPVVSGALGGLVLITALPLLVSMAFTLVLLPVAGVVLVLLGLTAIVGLVAAGYALGGRAARRGGWTLQPPALAALGTALLVATLQVLARVPVVGVVVVATTLAVSVGAVALTRFGTRLHTPPDDAFEPPEATRPADAVAPPPGQGRGPHTS